MDLNTYVIATGFLALCGLFAGLANALIKLNDEARIEVAQLPFRLLWVLCIVYILMQMQFSTINLLQALPAIVTAVVVYRLARNWPGVRAESRWPLVGFVAIPLLFHGLPRLGIALH